MQQWCLSKPSNYTELFKSFDMTVFNTRTLGQLLRSIYFRCTFQHIFMSYKHSEFFPLSVQGFFVFIIWARLLRKSLEWLGLVVFEVSYRCINTDPIRCGGAKS